jgi:CRP-like cAMP-binding protein
MFGDVGQLQEFTSRLDLIELTAGSTLIQSGDPAGHMDFVESGRLVVLSSDRDDARVRRAGPGSILGIASFFRRGGQMSLVTLRAETDCRIRRLTGDAYFRLASEEPAIAAALQRHVLVTIADRYSVLLSSFDSVMKGKL